MNRCGTTHFGALNGKVGDSKTAPAGNRGLTHSDVTGRADLMVAEHPRPQVPDDTARWIAERTRKRESALRSPMMARVDQDSNPLYRVTSGGNIVRTRPITQHLKRRILTRDGFACVECGARERVDVPWLEIAHIEAYRVNGDNSDANLRTLCPSCHRAEGA